jgi:integrase
MRTPRERHPHDLRHRYISLLVMAGVPIPVVRNVVGHSRASVTLDFYSHALLDEPREVLAERREIGLGARGAQSP